MDDVKQLHRIIEGALFAVNEPLSIERIIALFAENDKPDKLTVRTALQQLVVDYEARGIELKELASGFQFQVKSDLSQWIKKLWEDRPPRYSRALMETLAIIAYRQPVTRGEIEEIRGVVVSSPMMKTLLERNWVRIIGYRDVPGKPGIYATTKQFLDYFGLKKLSDLPPLAEVRNLDQIGVMLEKQLQGRDVSDMAADHLKTEALGDTTTAVNTDAIAAKAEIMEAAVAVPTDVAVDITPTVIIESQKNEENLQVKVEESKN